MSRKNYDKEDDKSEILSLEKLIVGIYCNTMMKISRWNNFPSTNHFDIFCNLISL